MPPQIGLATGAGAAGGLETLLARYRAEEVMRQHQQQIDQTKVYQDKNIELQQAGSRRADVATGIASDNARTEREVAGTKLGILRQIAGQSGGPTAGNANASSTGVSDTAPRPNPAEASVVPTSTSGAADNSMGQFNNPRGRTMFQIAGLNPNESFGSIQQPQRPENLSPEESFYASAARERGLSDYHQLPSAEMAELRKRWAVEGRVFSPAQMTEPALPVDDPNNPGSTIWKPRSDAMGQRTGLPAGQKERLQAYDVTLSLVDQIERLGNEINWKGIGPVEGRVGSAAMTYLGHGDPREEQLRTMINNLKAQASFQEGGKQFTGTESQLLSAFLTGVHQNPVAAKERLALFKAQAQRSKASLSGAMPTDPGGAPTPPPGPGAAAPATGDLYDQWLASRKKPGGQP